MTNMGIVDLLEESDPLSRKEVIDELVELRVMYRRMRDQRLSADVSLETKEHIRRYFGRKMDALGQAIAALGR